MTMSFAQKQLRFTFVLDGDLFPGTTSNTLQISGLRASVTVEAQGDIYGSCSARIFGMSQDDMNKLPFFTFNPRSIGQSVMRVESNDGITGWFRVFEGQIIEAGPDYSAVPDVALTVLARSLYTEALRPVNARSFPGTVSVASIAEGIITAMGRKFENGGVTSTITDAYLPGTLTDQLDALMSHAQPPATWYDDPPNNAIAICPVLQPRAVAVFKISSITGMAGYPTYNNLGPAVEVLYNPSIRIGGRVEIDSDLIFANGLWTVIQITTELSAETPNGPWFSKLQCVRYAIGGVPQ